MFWDPQEHKLLDWGVGGGDTVVAETCEYNGSGWTDVGNDLESRKMMGRSGTQTAALFERRK